MPKTQLANKIHKPNDNYIITGTSGTGKTSLIEELKSRGHVICNEAQRQVLTDQLAIDGPALPSKNATNFIQALVDLCNNDLAITNKLEGLRFFDRGIPDIAAYAIRFEVDFDSQHLVKARESYNPVVFLLAPWKEIFLPDEIRGKSFEEYVTFHSVIEQCYLQAGFTFVTVPNVSVSKRADSILNFIQNQPRNG